MKKCRIGWGMLICISLLTGCRQNRVEKSVKPVEVKIMKMVLTEIDTGQEYSGTIEEESGSSLSFSVSGTIKQIPVVEGQHVTKGQLIAVVDDESFRNGYEAALSMREQAQDTYDRMKQLHDNGSLPEIQWVEAESKLRQAVSSEQIAKKNLNDTKLYAPYSGVISEKNVEIGQNVMPGQSVVRLVTIDQVKVCASIPENEISQINMGVPVNVRVSALNGKTFSGKIVEKGVMAHPLSRSYEVKALIDNHSGELMPGMICTMGIENGASNSVITLPTSVIQTDEQNRTFVWVNEGGKARKKIVQTGTLTRNSIVIASGISVGDEVIVEGQQKVSKGMDVTAK